MGEDLFDDVSEENQSQVTGPGGVAQNDPPDIPPQNSGGPSMDDQGQNGGGAGGGSEGGGGGSGGSAPGEIGNANDKFDFKISGPEFEFNPKYYPDRFNVKKPRDIEEEADSCKGENLTLNMVNNSKIHAKGILLYGRNLSDFHSLCDYAPSIVTLYNAVLPTGSMECMIEKPEYGNIAGYDPDEEDWLVEYTIDLSSTGADESTGSGAENRGIIDGGTISSGE